MSPEELDSAWSGFIQDLQNIGGIMVTIGQDARAMIYERVHGSGTDAEGQKYAPYSTKPMLSGCSGFINKNDCPAKTKKARKELRWVTIQKGGKNYRLFVIPGGYKEFRSMNQGLQTSFVDFSFTNRMWSDIKVVSDSSEHDKGIVRISTTLDSEQKKLTGNTERKGKILSLSQEEIAEISETFDGYIDKMLVKNRLK